MIAAMALGENPLELWDKRRNYAKAGLAKMILETEKSGILDQVGYNGEKGNDIVEISFFKHPGDEIRAFENSNDCLGQIIVQGDTLPDCKKMVNDVLDKIYVTLK